MSKEQFKYKYYFYSFFFFLNSFSLDAAIHDDPDEKFDSSLFKFPLYFNGSFQLHDSTQKEDHETLTDHLQQKVCPIIVTCIPNPVLNIFIFIDCICMCLLFCYFFTYNLETTPVYMVNSTFT